MPELALSRLLLQGLLQCLSLLHEAVLQGSQLLLIHCVAHILAVLLHGQGK